MEETFELIPAAEATTTKNRSRMIENGMKKEREKKQVCTNTIEFD